MMMNNPFLSVVIATYNYGRFLEQAIKSVLAQNRPDVELIVVDGGSKDNTVEVIKKFEDKIAWWVSEPDKGQSNAFNKGFAHAHGKYLTWLNADDLLLPGTVDAVEKAFMSCPRATWATGNFLRYRLSDDVIIQASWGPRWWPFIFQRTGFPIPCFGPSTFWSRDAYEKVGPIDESNHYTMDVDYWKRLTMAGFKQVRINHCCWAFGMHENSKTAEFGEHERSQKIKDLMRQELRQIDERTKHHVGRFGHIVMTLLRLLDGSAITDLYRRIFVQGKTLRSVYNVVS